MSNAKWIWSTDHDPHDYNQAVDFKREFEVSDLSQGLLRITADSRYRVTINGHWLNDGPGRAYPSHWTYDVYDISDYLKKGTNDIEVLVRYYGVGTFHEIPQQAGLLAELQLAEQWLGTDDSWLCRRYHALCQWTPKVSIQMEPVEQIDGSQLNTGRWRPAKVFFEADGGPWKNCRPRRSEPMTKQRCRPVAEATATTIQRDGSRYCVPVTQIAHPREMEANHLSSRPVVLTATMEVVEQTLFDTLSEHWLVELDGECLQSQVKLEQGRYELRFYCRCFYGHNKDLQFPYLSLPKINWENCRVHVIEEFLFLGDDIEFPLWFDNPEASRLERDWGQWIETVQPLGEPEVIDIEKIFMVDFCANFANRQPLEAIDIDGEELVLEPLDGADLELCFDFGEQKCGYLEFKIQAAAGTIMDIHMVEYISEENILQHTYPDNRNGMRFTAKDGENSYRSLKRRSGRYAFVTLRQQVSTVIINDFILTESTAAVEPVQPFRCSDEQLNAIWEICERTLKLGMEDTFTDCSLYEQTLWIGDARNQALYAFETYGEYAVSARSLELGAQSLEHFPLVGCQVPSTWRSLIPAWSFLWGIHVWEHHFASGDKALLRSLWPAVVKNMDSALDHIDASGLFSGKFWNLLEWADIDQEQETVLHNSMLLVKALRAAENCAMALDETSSFYRFTEKREQLIEAINSTWDDAKKSYPDAILNCGRPSDKTCQHNAALAVMAQVLPSQHVETVRHNLLKPPAGMTGIASPFASQFLFEALDIMGEPQAILDDIKRNYSPMIDAGATTVWETYPGSTCSPKGFPTRSHCHGWSCGPLLFFNRIILGIRQIAPGGCAFSISPWLGECSHASGGLMTPNGKLSVHWKLSADDLLVKISSPEGVEINWSSNSSHDGLNVVHL